MITSKSPVRTISLLAVTVACSMFASSCQRSEPPKQSEKRELRVLAWVGYEEPEIVGPFEKEFGVNVRTETFTGADRMFAKMTQTPDAYDLVVIDPEYIAKLHKAGLLSELPKQDFDFSDYIEPLRDFPLCTIDGKFYTVLIRYGVNGLVYNTDKLTPQDVKSYKILWSPKVKGKVGIWDWYLPNMGVLSLAAGNKDPYRLSDAQFQLLSTKLLSLRPQVNAILGTFSDVNSAFARGDIWVTPALGEHTAAVLSEQGYHIAWTVPSEGAIMWIETLGIPPAAKNRDLALKYIHYFQRPEVQAAMAWRRAYRSNIPSERAINLLTPAQRDALKVHDAQEGTALVRSLHIRSLPTDLKGGSLENQWQGKWQEFKVGR